MNTTGLSMKLHLAPHVWSVTSINESLQHPGESLPGLSARWGDRLLEENIYFPYRKHRKNLAQRCSGSQLSWAQVTRAGLTRRSHPHGVFEVCKASDVTSVEENLAF